jgi:energy-coupling factor transporter ATP-binding protein EcfA2
MRARLGFAIAAHLDPDVLLIDEVLAVGDVGFRGKCYNRLAEMQDRSAFILVTHNMEAIARVCNHGMLLVGGRLRYLGNSTQAAHAYFEEFEPSSGVQRSDGVQLVSSQLDETLAEHNGYPPSAITIRLRVVCEFSRAILMPELVVCVASMAGEYVTHNSNVFSGDNFPVCGPGVVAFDIVLQEMRLASATYAVSFALRDHSRRSFLLWAPRLQTFHVRTNQIASAHYVPAASFRIEQDPHASSMPLVSDSAAQCTSDPPHTRSA